MTQDIGLIRGVMPQSKEEWYTALALQKLGLPFDFQVPLRGGRLVAGGYVVDFVVYAPFPEPLEVFGEYWHEASLSSAERYRLAVIENVYHKPVNILWARDAQSVEDAKRAIKRLLL